MAFDKVMARNVAMQYCDDQGEEFGLVDAFEQSGT